MQKLVLKIYFCLKKRHTEGLAILEVLACRQMKPRGVDAVFIDFKGNGEYFSGSTNFVR